MGINIGDEVRISTSCDTGIVLDVVGTNITVRCDCGLTFQYDVSQLTKLEELLK